MSMKCKNGPGYYKGTEPSPKGLGFCARNEHIGGIRRGRDGYDWKVSPNGRWVRFMKNFRPAHIKRAFRSKKKSRGPKSPRKKSKRKSPRKKSKPNPRRKKSKPNPRRKKSKSKRKCKYGKLKNPVRSASGRMRYCKKS